MANTLISQLGNTIICKEEQTMWFYSEYFTCYGRALDYCLKLDISFENIWEIINVDGTHAFFVRSRESTQ